MVSIIGPAVEMWAYNTLDQLDFDGTPFHARSIVLDGVDQIEEVMVTTAHLDFMRYCPDTTDNVVDVIANDKDDINNTHDAMVGNTLDVRSKALDAIIKNQDGEQQSAH